MQYFLRKLGVKRVFENRGVVGTIILKLILKPDWEGVG
jgi:hypothetical protein